MELLNAGRAIITVLKWRLLAMEKTIYEIKYNDWFTVRMTSEQEPMEEIEFDKAAFQAVLADIVLRAMNQPSAKDETEAVWRWICTEIGIALQNTGLTPDAEAEPLESLINVVSGFKEKTDLPNRNDKPDSFNYIYWDVDDA
jgi:hypothetical protein